ncbi:5'/3'-nucleotidase SurE [Streptomyces cavernicola]|uniref:5'-nucleotidase n=1 Tax=Streptomyces cavernicola TaxID=3043613 RepID=A0ABT6SF21_9ACTN|nr:5'/3'-nucleotidase SurE [Streptomyces sp. B-S-A6]MDI3406544.1 5'/3'-nucleotidase SurE [Streptomyces sp. B-S-A6]
MNRRLFAISLAAAVLGTTGVGIAATASATASASPESATRGVTERAAAAQAAEGRPLDILLTNDDGWIGEGGSETPLIVALRDALRKEGHHVTVVAAGTNQTGQGGRISLPPNKLTVANPEKDVYTVTPGSPSDSVYFGMDEIFADKKPDLVVSGINPGNNLGQAVAHSGTFNAASAALEFGVPSIAVSQDEPKGWAEGGELAGEQSAQYVVDLVAKVQNRAGDGPLMPKGAGLNVNLPVRPGPVDPATGKPGSVLPPKGSKVTTLDTGSWIDFDYKSGDAGADKAGTYEIGLAPTGQQAAEGTDTRAVQDGYAAVHPFEADRDVDASTVRWAGGLL